MQILSVEALPLRGDQDHHYTIELVSADRNCKEQFESVISAISNHDALALAVSDLLYLSTILKHKMRKQTSFPEAYQLRIDHARNLLAKIEGKK